MKKSIVLEQQSDSDLVKGIRKSDCKAFQTLFERYYNQLYHYVWRCVHQEEVSKDMMQEIFLRLWNHREKLDPDKSIQAFLYRTAYNLRVDHIRKHHREQELPDHDLEDGYYRPDNQIDFENRLEYAFKMMPENVKQVFLMNRFEGLKYKEIADICAVSVKTVEARMGKALQVLRKVFSD